MSAINNPIDTAQHVIDKLREYCESDMDSAILYGSAAGGDFNPRTSDINLLLVVKDMSFDLMLRIGTAWRVVSRKRLSRPLIMDKAYIATALDSFPIEFLNMKSCYQVLWGEDVLKDLQIKPGDIRLQAERELRGKLLHLISQSIEAKASRRLLIELCSASLRDFGPVFRALLFLKGIAIPKDRKSVFASFEEVLAIEGKPFSGMWDALRTGNKRQVESIFPSYFDGIRKIIERIN